MTNEQLWTDADTEALRGIGQFHGSPHNLLGRRAADEIERLRGKLDFANREPPHCPTCSCGQHEPLPYGWQPIETAPKDGSSILAYFDYNPIYRDSSEKWFCTVVRWSGEYSMWSMPGISGLSPKLWQPITYPNGVVSANGLKS